MRILEGGRAALRAVDGDVGPVDLAGPLVAWSERFKLEQSAAAETAQSAVLTALRRSAALDWAAGHVAAPLGSGIDRRLRHLSRPKTTVDGASGRSAARPRRGGRVVGAAIGLLLAGAVVWGVLAAIRLLAEVEANAWGAVGLGALATLARTSAALLIGAAWTVRSGWRSA